MHWRIEREIVDDQPGAQPPHWYVVEVHNGCERDLPGTFDEQSANAHAEALAAIWRSRTDLGLPAKEVRS